MRRPGEQQLSHGHLNGSSTDSATDCFEIQSNSSMVGLQIAADEASLNQR